MIAQIVMLIETTAGYKANEEFTLQCLPEVGIQDLRMALVGLNLLVLVPDIRVVVPVSTIVMKVILKTMRHMMRMSQAACADYVPKRWAGIKNPPSWQAIEVMLSHWREHGLLSGWRWRELELPTLGSER
jgi:hypothetical protein